jgi:hypothetical protein
MGTRRFGDKMRLSPENKNLLLNEIDIVRKKMKQENDPRRKMFYYSGLFNIMERIYNIEYNPHLVIMQIVFNVSFTALNTRIMLRLSGDVTVQVPEDLFDSLDKLLEQIYEKIDTEEDTYSVLEKLACLAYSLSGNGYYQIEKGVKVFSL